MKRSPLHERLAEAGAIFGVTAGWGRPWYFAVSGDDTLPYPHTEQPWWTLAEAECAAMSRGAGIIEVYARAGQPVACTPWTLAGATHQSGRALFDGEFCQHHIDAELQAFIESRKAELLH